MSHSLKQDDRVSVPGRTRSTPNRTPGPEPNPNPDPNPSLAICTSTPKKRCHWNISFIQVFKDTPIVIALL